MLQQRFLDGVDESVLQISACDGRSWCQTGHHRFDRCWCHGRRKHDAIGRNFGQGSLHKDNVGCCTGVFRRDTTPDPNAIAADDNDPLRLDNKPDQVDPEVFVANGQLWESTGDMTKAMESYTRALESNPKHAPALTSLARSALPPRQPAPSGDLFSASTRRETSRCWAAQRPWFDAKQVG